MTKLVTTLGPKSAIELGLILPHEHIFVEFRSPDHPEHALAEVADVVALMAPEVEEGPGAGRNRHGRLHTGRCGQKRRYPEGSYRSHGDAPGGAHRDLS
jgi:phosphotriesterase-related protein